MKQKRQIVLLLGLILIASAVLYFDQKGPGFPSVRASTQHYPPLTVENPSLRRDKLQASQATEYRSSGRDLFSDVVAARKAVPKKREPVGPQKPPDPPPPPPLTLPVKFYGYGTVPGGTKRAFLTDGEDIYIVGEGDTLLGRFRILKIGNATLDFEEISSSRRGTAPLEEQAAPPQ